MNPPDPYEEIRQAEHALMALWLGLDLEDGWGTSGRVPMLPVRAGERWYAVPVERLVEVLPVCWLEPIPGAPSWVLGAVHLGEEPVSVIDLSQRVGEGKSSLALEQFLVILTVAGQVALLIDEFGEIVDVDVSAARAVQTSFESASWCIGTTMLEQQPVQLLSLVALCRGISSEVAL